MNNAFNQAKIEEYQAKFREHKGSPKSLKWTSNESAVERYRQIVADIDFESKSILDVGCGFGDIIPYIAAETQSFKYAGIDMVPEFVELAQQRYPDHDFHVGTYFESPLKQQFDIVLCCGALNSNMENAIEYRKQAIATMFAHANTAVVFNMAGHHPRPKYPDTSTVYYADSKEILEYCYTLTSKLILRQHYSKKDFTVVLFK